MPILIDYNPGGGADLLNLAQQTGTLQGQAQNRTQQRAIDAGVQRQAIAAAEERNSQPGFYDRVSQNAAAEGRYAQERQDALEARDSAQNEREQTARRTAITADNAKTEGKAQREQAARLIEDFNKSGGTTEAAQQYVANATRKGIKPEARIVDAAGPLKPSEQTANVRAQTAAGNAGTAQDIAQQRLDETKRANQQRETIQRERIKAGPSARGIGAGVTTARAQTQDEFDAWSNHPADVAAALEPQDGKLSAQGGAVTRGLFAPTRTPGQIGQKIDELEQAGTNPVAVKEWRAAQGRLVEKYRKIDDIIGTLPPNVSVDQALSKLGMSRQQYDQYLREAEQEAGLAPP